MLVSGRSNEGDRGGVSRVRRGLCPYEVNATSSRCVLGVFIRRVGGNVNGSPWRRWENGRGRKGAVFPLCRYVSLLLRGFGLGERTGVGGGWGSVLFAYLYLKVLDVVCGSGLIRWCIAWFGKMGVASVTGPLLPSGSVTGFLGPLFSRFFIGKGLSIGGWITNEI